ncbi:putative secreted protein (Por secretion system target) [Flavobacterium croceum DSM 17960]|uniref:Putative secreted protein (Por secretion system target) n=1 Tax=Flavobacterium croceum DSM 17960 TaxID=1121886 RepID=A0A2S4NBD8_9FLAO|nr:T9SS type A sorting domain-containing protein [Flavobacterium croceum]POS03018.1 putative secreted protein (Por secretion system target) [Flavobacterium croceum DSM 17960]
MKKITLFFLSLIAVPTVSEAQVVASQNFDTALGWTTTTVTNDSGATINAWSRRTTGGAPACSPFAGAGMARFNSYNIPSNGVGTLTSPTLTFSGATYRVKLKMYRDDGYTTDADKIDVYYNTTATAGGTLLGTVNRSITLAPAVSGNGWYSYSFDIPGTLTGTGYINIKGTSNYGNNIFIDEVSVEQIPNLDLELSTFTINSIIPNGTTSVPIEGSFQNQGSSTITSFNLNWQEGTGAVHTQTITGLSLAAGQTYAVTHQDAWNCSPGLYSLKLWVSNINGSGADAVATNDQIIKSISVASNSVARLPLYEEFSSSTCGPCATFNNNYYNPFHTNNGSNFASIAYRVDWPGTGDPYNTAEVDTRVGYYGITAAPTLLVDSVEGTNFNTSLLQQDLTNALAKPSYFTINATKELSGNIMNVSINTMPYISGTYRVFAAVVEGTTYNNTASNGETSFHEVFMKMLPSATGQTVNFVYNQPTTTTLSADLTGTFIEQMTDLKVVVFIQDYATKNVMQAKYATQALAVNNTEFAKNTSLYPNPSTGIFYLKATDACTVQITDISGKVVYTQNSVLDGQSVNLSQFSKGIYLATLSNGDSQSTQKIIIN